MRADVRPASRLTDRIPAIRERVSAADLFEAFGELAVRGRYRCPSPDHPDVHPSCTVKGDRWKCWSCGALGDQIDLLVLLAGITKSQAIERLAAHAGISRA